MTDPPQGVLPPAVVLATRDRRSAHDAALVLRAAGIPHDVLGGGAGWQVLVPAHAHERALEELGAFAQENADWPPPRAKFVPLSLGRLGAAVYAALMIALFPIGQLGVGGRNWWTAGRMDGGALLAGEWERTLTALTLHADLPHLAGNLVFGCLFGVLASHTLGSGLAWLLAVLAGALGNLVNGLVVGPDHLSVGASTAVFALLGVQSAYEWKRREAFPFAALRRTAPLFGAAVLLGYLGVGGGEEGPENVDVGAHVFGFGTGLLWGLAAGFGHWPSRLGRRGQAVCGALALVLLLVAWAQALGR